ncbi:hypothetical protein GCM10011414_13810 [Croceivirga lutea]|nr:hypothetical protein GCM10011414_13810 [Croceivirga lutea]
MHLHPDRYTFSYILSGGAQFIHQQRLYTLTKGDIVVIPPYIAHQTLIEDYFHYQVIRVPNLFVFCDAKEKQGIHILKNQPTIVLQFQQWFEAIQSHNHQSVPIPLAFQSFLRGQQESNHPTFNKVKVALTHLHQNFQRKIAVEALSDLTHLSESSFQRIFKNTMGISPTRYLLNLRIEKAKELIKESDSLTNIAYDTGFFDQSHFTKYFKINVGMLPKRYAAIVKK